MAGNRRNVLAAFSFEAKACRNPLETANERHQRNPVHFRRSRRDHAGHHGPRECLKRPSSAREHPAPTGDLRFLNGRDRLRLRRVRTSFFSRVPL
jgi:hypothetical protein